MKPSPFAYRRAETLDAALALLSGHSGEAAPIAGGQSLTPLLNLRMAMCDTLVDIARLPELRETRDLGAAVFIGAGVTHAMIEDGAVPDPSNGLMRRAAAHIAYRAVRCHGTIGGSVAMADPAADWPCVLLALDATAIIAAAGVERRVAMDDLLVGTYETSLHPGEIIRGFEIPILPAGAATAYSKVNRKTGAFADSLAVAVRNGARTRVALGAAGTRARLLPLTSSALGKGDAASTLAPLVARDIATILPEPDPYLQNLHEANVKRVLAEALAR